MTLKFVVWAEYASSGIWRHKPDGVSMVEHEEIGLLPELSQRFNAWIESYLARLPPEAVSITFPESFFPDKFDSMGRELARELKAFVGPDVVVEYAPFHRGESRAPRELID